MTAEHDCADWVDPEALVAGLRREFERVWWLDGRGASTWSGRTTLIGWLDEDEPSLSWHSAEGVVREHVSGRSAVVGTDPFRALAERVTGGHPDERWVGWFGYGCRDDLPARTDGQGSVADVCWLRARRWVELDHHTSQLRLVGFDTPPDLGRLVRVRQPVPAAAPTATTVSTWSEQRYARAFADVQRALRAGHSYEVNLTYRHRVASSLDPWVAYRGLRRANPAPYAAFVQHGGTALLASSPERFATIRAGVVETRPVKGTVARNPDPVQDAALATGLAGDPRLRAENLIVCDLLRNDVAGVSELGSVEVPMMLGVETHPGLHQLVSVVRGRLRAGVTPLDAVRALLPGGSMTGAPKLRTMEVIAAVEDDARGVYSGAFGWVSASGADLGMVIRSWVHADGIYTAGTGGGVTVLSRAAQEYAETRLKLARLRAALGA
ncbi:MAG TPA: anthranilate synthase component I family protein [Nocardioidaceae bacterium]|nr:anthranilate synthase component I family protein [Nocardioidaceae bacterium]